VLFLSKHSLFYFKVKKTLKLKKSEVIFNWDASNSEKIISSERDQDLFRQNGKSLKVSFRVSGFNFVPNF